MKLSPQQRKVMRLFERHTLRTWTANEVATMLGMPVASAGRTLGELRDPKLDCLIVRMTRPCRITGKMVKAYEICIQTLVRVGTYAN